MPTEFLHGIIPTLTFPSSSVLLLDGAGQFRAGGTLHLFIQGRNRAGYTEPSAVVTVNYAATQAIQINFLSVNRTHATDFHYYVVSHSPTGNSEDATALFHWTSYESDQITTRVLSPSVLSRDAHVVINESVATPPDLPTGSDLIDGMTRLVVGGGVPTSAYYQYRKHELRAPDGVTVLQPRPGEKWVRTGSPNVGLIQDIYDVDGCAQPIESVSTDSLILPPSYAADGTKGTPLKIIYRNDDDSPLPAGTPFDLSVTLNGAIASQLFDGKLLLAPRGFVDLTDGSIDTSDGIGGTMPYTGEDLPYTYGDRSSLILHKDLPPGKAYYLEVSAYFTRQQFRGGLLEGSQVSVLLNPAAQSGDPAFAIWKVTGDIVFADGDRCLVVPGVGTEARMLSGAALIQRFVFPPRSERAVYGIQPNTADQQITLDGNGSLFYRGIKGTDKIPGTEALRALVSCEPGISVSSLWSTPQQVLEGGAIVVTLSYPCDDEGKGTIRVDYPNLANTKVRFNPPFVQLFVKVSSSGKIYQLGTRTPVLADSSQVTALASLDGAIEITSLPYPLKKDFCLFSSPSVAIAADPSGGALSADIYSVAAAYHFDGSTISSISHSVDDGCLYAVDGQFADLFEHLKRTDNPHSVTAAQTGAVDLTTTQTINGIKTFRSVTNFNNFINIVREVSNSRFALSTFNTGDAFNTFAIRTSGLIQWGTSVADFDTNLYREATGILRTNGTFSAARSVSFGSFGSLRPVNNINTAFETFASGDTKAAFLIAQDGTLKWGVGGSISTDTLLYRNGTGILKTDGDFQVGGRLAAGIASATEIQGRAIANTSPTDGQALAWDSVTTAWTPKNIVTSIPDATLIGKGIVQLSKDLAGTATAPIVRGIQGRSVLSTLPVNGQVLAWSEPNQSWIPSHSYRVERSNIDDFSNAFATINPANSFEAFALRTSGRMWWGTGVAALDTYLYRNATNQLRTGSLLLDNTLEVQGNVTFRGTLTVNSGLNATQLQGRRVSGLAPANKQALVWDESASVWWPEDVSVPDANTTIKGKVRLAQDLSGTADSPTVRGLQGRALAATTPTNGQVYAYNETLTQWVPTTIAVSTGSSSNTGSNTALLLDLTNTAPNTGPNQIAIFADAASGQLKKRAPNNGQVVLLESPFTTSAPTTTAPAPEVISPIGTFQSSNAVLVGSEGMSQIISNHADDNAIALGGLGYQFPFYANFYSGADMYICSNSFITIGLRSTAYTNFTPQSPGRGLFVYSGDRSWEKIFVKVDSQGRSFRVRYEGYEGTGRLPPTTVWESTLFADGTIQLVLGNFVPTTGVSHVTDASTTNPNRYTSYAPAVNTSYVFQRQSSTIYTVAQGSYILN